FGDPLASIRPVREHHRADAECEVREVGDAGDASVRPAGHAGLQGKGGPVALQRVTRAPACRFPLCPEAATGATETDMPATLRGPGPVLLSRAHSSIGIP